MFDFEIAFFLYKIAKILAVFEDNKYKSQAYFKAAMAIDAYDRYAYILLTQNRLNNIAGIGDSSAKLIKEIIETGKCNLLSQLEEKYAITDYSLLLSYGLSNKLLEKLFNNGITSYHALLAVFENFEVSVSFLSKSEKNAVQDFFAAYEKENGFYLFSYAYCLCNELVDLVNEKIGNVVCEFGNEFSNKLDCGLIRCLFDDRQKVFDLVVSSGRYYDVVFGANSAILCKSAFGLPIKIEMVQSLRNQSRVKILRGDLHMHTTWSDGTHSIAQMASRAKELGREYIGITDHSYSLRVANGISEVDAKQQITEIRNLEMQGIKVFAGIEVEVLQDGTLDYSDALLSEFDYVIAGIHSHFNQTPMQLRERIEKALGNPYVNIFAHPSARLLGRPGILFSSRTPYSISTEQIIQICKKLNVALEFNAFPERFDIDTRFFDTIIESEVMVSVGTDAHSAAHLSCLDFAELALQSYPKLKSNVINTFNSSRLQKFFKEQRTSKVVADDNLSLAVAKDFNYFFGNNSSIIDGEYSVIGIDLTGSEAKPSGFAVMTGNKVKTAMLLSDTDLIQESLKYNPKVISIDSPLSYPAGRCCAKENCDCTKYGITRYCERLLSSFGIHAYPCLIPSMVNLTTRGMRLAEKFRALGVEVIESYPGAAQDIMSIRRKQNGLTHLINGYKSFGIVGEYTDSATVKHDELDAIMSALVGLFYLNNQYVALGSVNENYLIVPSVAERPQKPKVIGLVGEISAGKTTVVEYLKFAHGFRSFRYSQVIRELYHCGEDRTTLQRIGFEIASDREKQRALSLHIVNKIRECPDCNYVIDGLRQDVDYETLSEYFGESFMLVFIDASVSSRLNHYRKLNGDISRDKFLDLCRAPSESGIIGLMFKTPYRIDNNKTYKEYFEKFDRLLEEIQCL